jgi:cytochrome c oxidase cbb3-type subunit 3
MTIGDREGRLAAARRRRDNAAVVWVMVLAVGLLANCEREERRFRDASVAAPGGVVVDIDLRPGGAPKPGFPANPYQDNAFAMAEGKRLYGWYNCVGCHANGGGGMGPALMDQQWIYGSEPAQIFASIVEGRPNGMPAFAGKINDQEVWELVAFVRSLSGLARMDVAGGRDDHMQVKPAEQAMEAEEPKNAVPPPAQ